MSGHDWNPRDDEHDDMEEESSLTHVDYGASESVEPPPHHHEATAGSEEESSPAENDGEPHPEAAESIERRMPRRIPALNVSRLSNIKRETRIGAATMLSFVILLGAFIANRGGKKGEVAAKPNPGRAAGTPVAINFNPDKDLSTPKIPSKDSEPEPTKDEARPKAPAVGEETPPSIPSQDPDPSAVKRAAAEAVLGADDQPPPSEKPKEEPKKPDETPAPPKVETPPTPAPDEAKKNDPPPPDPDKPAPPATEAKKEPTPTPPAEAPKDDPPKQEPPKTDPPKKDEGPSPADLPALPGVGPDPKPGPDAPGTETPKPADAPKPAEAPKPTEPALPAPGAAPSLDPKGKPPEIETPKPLDPPAMPPAAANGKPNEPKTAGEPSPLPNLEVTPTPAPLGTPKPSDGAPVPVPVPVPVPIPLPIDSGKPKDTPSPAPATPPTTANPPIEAPKGNNSPPIENPPIEQPKPKPAEPTPLDAGQSTAAEPSQPITSTPTPTVEPSQEATPAPRKKELEPGFVPLRNLGKTKILDVTEPADLVDKPAPKQVIPDAPPPRVEPSRHDDSEPVLHTVGRGENFWTISRLYYGSGRYYKALWNYNVRAVPRIAELYVGTTIKVPPPELLDSSLIEPPSAGSASSSRSAPASSKASRVSEAPPRRAPRPADPDLSVRKPSRIDEEQVDAPVRPTYRVQPHDTLRGIAKQTLGDARREREILDLNRDVITDPRRLVSGQVLVLPEDASVGTKIR